MSNPTSYFELCKMTLNSVSVCPSNMTMTASSALLCAAEEQLSTALQKEKLRHRASGLQSLSQAWISDLLTPS